MSKKMIVAAVLTVLFGFSGVPFHAAQQTEVIRVPQDFATIQEAIDASLPGDTIRVNPKPDGGSYEENLIIDKGIKLIGKSRNEVTITRDGINGKPIILIESNFGAQVTIESFTITSARGGEEARGMRISGTAKVAIGKVQIYDNNYSGLFVEGSAQVMLTDSTVSDNGTNGITIMGSAQATLTNSTVSDNGSAVSGNQQNSNLGGLFVGSLAQVTLTNSTVSGNRFNGLRVADSAQVTLTNSTVSGNRQNGLSLADSAAVEIRGSVTSGNQGCGIQAGEGAQVTGGGNTIANNHGGELCGNVLASLWRITNPTQLSATVPNDFSTIQGAIDALQPGGMLTILPKADGQPYRENLQIYHDLTLTVPQEDRGQVVLHGGGKTVVNVASQATQVTIEGLTIIRGYDGIRIEPGSQATVKVSENRIQMNESGGIVLRGSVTAIIDRNRILNNGGCGIVIGNSVKIENRETLLQRNGSAGNSRNTC